MSGCPQQDTLQGVSTERERREVCGYVGGEFSHLECCSPCLVVDVHLFCREKKLDYSYSNKILDSSISVLRECQSPTKLKSLTVLFLDKQSALVMISIDCLHSAKQCT